MSTCKIRILHIISGLNIGGAEMVLYRLLSNIDRKTFDSQVISLTTAGQIGPKIEKIGFPVIALGMHRGIPHPIYIFKLINLIKKFKTDIIQTWMYHADLIGGIAGKAIGSIPIIWNIRGSSLDKIKEKKLTWFTMKVNALLSYFIPTLILSVAEAAKQDAINHGYIKTKIFTIPNGVDTSIFKPDPTAGLRMRKRLNIPGNYPLVGLIARYDPQKDHLNFINATKIIHKQFPNVHFILCGEDVTWENEKIGSLISEMKLEKFFHLLGEHKNVQEIVASLDLAVLSSSYGEGFPNVLLEAMACGIPCVATDVGDSASIINNTGNIVPIKNPKALADGIIELLSMAIKERRRLGQLARQRIIDHFSLGKMISNYQKIYHEVYHTQRITIQR